MSDSILQSSRTFELSFDEAYDGVADINRAWSRARAPDPTLSPRGSRTLPHRAHTPPARRHRRHPARQIVFMKAAQVGATRRATIGLAIASIKRRGRSWCLAGRSAQDSIWGTTDFSPIIRALMAANPDLVVFCSYPLSSVGILLAANELISSAIEVGECDLL